MSIADISTAKTAYLNQFYQTLLSMLNSGSSGSGSGSSGDIPVPRLTLIGLTRVKIDEAMFQTEGVQFNLAGADNSNVIDLYINAILDESAKHILQTAPKHIINPTDGGLLTCIPVPNSSGLTGYVILPDDYLRFVSFKMPDWLQEVDEPILTTNPKYKLQKYAVTRGGIAKPVVVLSSRTGANTPVKQTDNVTFAGTSGSCVISGPGGLSKTMNFVTSLADTVAAWVTENTPDYYRMNIVLGYPSLAAYIPDNLSLTLNASGSLLYGTYYYRVTALFGGDETDPSTEVSIAITRLLSPVNYTHTPTTGSMAAGIYGYQVTAINALGETLASAVTTITLVSTGGVNVNWSEVAGATGYKIYGRLSAGGGLLIAIVGTVTTFHDDGSINPSSSLVPTTNTTGWGGINVNWASVPGATGYRIYGRSSGSELLINTVNFIPTFHDDGSLTPFGAMPSSGVSEGRVFFTALSAGVPFDHPLVLTTSGDLTADVVNGTPNLPSRGAKRVLEYYSVLPGSPPNHTIDRFLYIANVGAEYVQADLYDALTWMAASKLLQIWGEFSGNQAYADRAMKQVELSYQNLL